MKQWNIANDISQIRAKTDSDQWGTVYAIEYGKHLKIGRTKDLTKRVKTFLHQTSYNKVPIRKISYTPYHSNFAENEKLLHDLFKEFRTRGTELFDIGLKAFLEKVPELQFDKVMLDYSKDAHNLKKIKALTPINTALIPINDNITLPAREYSGERVITLKDIDLIHGKANGTAGRNFRRNKIYFISDIDYFEITNGQIVREFGFEKNASAGILITKTGYMMLAKSFTDKLAWAIQRQLVVNYFDSMPDPQAEFGAAVFNLAKNMAMVNAGGGNSMMFESSFVNGEKEKASTVAQTVEVSTNSNSNESSFSNSIISDMPPKVKSFRCNIDTVPYKTKDEAKKKTGAIVNRMKAESRIMEVTAAILAEVVTEGFCFTTAALRGTAEKNFVSQQLLIADIDIEREDIPLTTVDEAIMILTKHHIDYSFFYYSFSHSTAKPKFRIVCVLPEPITDPAQAKRLNQYFINLFSQADTSCFNLDRFYYGTDKGLATKIYDRTTTVNVPAGWQSELPSTPEQAQKKVASFPMGEAKNQTGYKNDDSFDLTQAIREFNLLAYIEQTEGMQGKQRGKDVLFNPCPICGHHDDFYVDTKRNLFKCHSSHNGKGGNIINYIEQKHPEFDRKAAREYFIYDILKRDRNADKTAYKKDKKSARQNGADEYEEQYEELTIAGVEQNHGNK